jgi:hypothetical protein
VGEGESGRGKVDAKEKERERGGERGREWERREMLLVLGKVDVLRFKVE